ncbi:hypothetical protein [Prevotella corporis]|uniref:hypothetical protein n=1 Tax=Prevotella corporis TaxID=28128 RepID=UPI000418C08F|nr:hypothetical protein [Prevotella corporis]
MEDKYWGLCESCKNSVDTGPTIECGLNLLYCNNHYEPMEELDDESKNKGTEEDIIPF